MKLPIGASTAEFNGNISEKDGNYSVGFAMATRTAAGQKGELELPHSFDLSLSRYEGSARHAIQARLRFSTDNGKLLLWYDLNRVAKFEEQALQSVASDIQTGTELTAWYGTP